MQNASPRRAPAAAWTGAALVAFAFSAFDAEQRRTAPADAPAPAAEPLIADRIAVIAADSGSWLALDRAPRLRATPCMSAAEDADLRLAHVFACDPAAYRGLESGASQRDQALVLSTYDAVEWTPPGPGRPPAGAVVVDGTYYVGGAPREQLVMARDGDGPWTFGVVERDGSVRDAGTTIKFCLRCHADTAYDGLIGLDADLASFAFDAESGAARKNAR